MVGDDLVQDFPAELLCFGGQPTALLVAETHPTGANLLAKDAILSSR